jgi:hypothetical protein
MIYCQRMRFRKNHATVPLKERYLSERRPGQCGRSATPKNPSTCPLTQLNRNNHFLSKKLKIISFIPIIYSRKNSFLKHMPFLRDPSFTFIKILQYLQCNAITIHFKIIPEFFLNYNISFSYPNIYIFCISLIFVVHTMLFNVTQDKEE